MRIYLRFLTWLFLGASVITCKPDPVIEPDLMTDGKPRIISIAFPGIPKEDVTIDQKNFLITVKVPPMILQNIIPEIVLTENARIMRGGCNDSYVQGVECMNDGNWIGLTYKETPQSPYTEPETRYDFQIIPYGPLEARATGQPLEYFLKPDFMHVPMVNLYGNPTPSSLQLTNLQTGEKLSLDSSKISKGFGQHVNDLALQLWYIERLVPGTYSMEFVSRSGKTFQIPQPLIVKMGPIKLDYELLIYFGYDISPGETLTLRGYNLFDGAITIKLTDRNGKTYQPHPLTFDPLGYYVRLPIPHDLPLGQYVMRVAQNGVEDNNCFRLNVYKEHKITPRIGTIGKVLLPCDLSQPFILQRQVPVQLTYTLNHSQSKDKPQIKLTSTDDPTQSYYGVVLPFDLPNPTGPAQLTIPTEVPPGLYTATLEYVDPEGKITAVSEPYGRILQVD